MSKFFQQIHYKGDHLFSPKEMEEICRDAFSKKFNWWVDQVSEWVREEIEMDFDSAINLLYKGPVHFSIIHKRGLEKWKNFKDKLGWFLQISFNTTYNEEGDIFVWIQLDEKWIPYFIEKYNLKAIN